ncbi:MAG: nitroreductase family protein [Nakamurella sp.]
MSDFAETEFGDRLTVVTRNDLNQIVVKVVDASPADNLALQTFVHTLAPEVASDVILGSSSLSVTAMKQIEAHAAEVIETPERPAGWFLDAQVRTVCPVSTVLRNEMAEAALRSASRPAAACGNVGAVNEATEGLLHPLLSSRWSPTTFDGSMDITGAQVESLLEAARWAPSAGNPQP